MIVRFAIDPDALLFSGYEPALQSKFTEDLFRVWRHCGILDLRSCSGGVTSLCDRIERLEQPRRSMWKEFLMRAQHWGLVQPVSAVASNGDLGDSMSVNPPVDVIAIKRDAAKAQGFRPDELARAGNPEVCRLEGIGESPAFRSAEEVREKGKCQRGELVQHIWNQLFKPLVDVFDPIVIIDHYCTNSTSLLTATAGQSGIERFLSFVDASSADARPKNIQIYSAQDDGFREDVVRRLHAFVKGLPNKRIGTLDLFTIPGKHFGRIVHYRYVRFHNYHCLQLDHGLEILRSERLDKTIPYAFLEFDEVFRSDEAALRAGHDRRLNSRVFRLPAPANRNVKPV